MMRVLLINPPYPLDRYPSPPYGLLALAAYLQKMGIQVIIEDYLIEPYSIEKAVKIINDYRPDIVGSTSVSITLNTALSILRDFKNISHGIITVIGGPHVTFEQQTALNSGGVDFIVRGEGEITFTELINALYQGVDVSGIKGISYLFDGDIINNPDREFIEDINSLPYPAINLVPLSKYKAMGFAINMLTTRGCPHKCVFCVGKKMSGSRLRYFDTERVVDEFQMLSRLGFSQINIVDDLFTSNKRRCIEICRGIIERGCRYPWSAFARVDTISDDLLDIMIEAGCIGISVGIENGNQHILDNIKKNITLERCNTAAAICREKNLTTLASFILGLPGETEETIEKTFSFAEKLGIIYAFHILSPFPGTEIRDDADKYGLKILTDDWNIYDAKHVIAANEGIPPERITQIASDFNNRVLTYIDSIATRKAGGYPITEDEKKLLRKQQIFDFNSKFIFSNIIENYPGESLADREYLMKNFLSYIKSTTGFNEDIADREIKRLFNIRCIDIVTNGEIYTLKWV